MRWLAVLVVPLLAGCGAAPDPPPAGPQPPPAGGARLDVRARTLTVDGRTVAAGVGPVGLAAHDGRFYVTDRVQGALLVFDLEPELELQRRVYLPGGPTDIAVRGDRLYVRLSDRDRVAILAADGVARTIDVRGPQAFPRRTA